MPEGWVSAEGVPTVHLVFAGRIWEAIVDTGFNGYFEFPEHLRDELEVEYQGRALSILASGIEIEEDCYLARVPFDGEEMRVPVTFAPVEEVLIGTQALRSHCLEINFPARVLKLWRKADSSG